MGFWMSLEKCAQGSLFYLLAFFAVLLPGAAFSEEAAFLRVLLNSEEAGEFYSILTDDGDVLISREDLARTRLLEGIGREEAVSGRGYVSLRSIQGLDFRIDVKTASLVLTAEPSLFSGQNVDVSYRRPYKVTYTKNNSAFFNYGLRYDSAGSAFDLSAEAGLRIGEYLGASSFGFTSSESGERAVRLLSSVTTDERKTLSTITAGDFTASSGLPDSPLYMGGLRLMKNFSIDPYFIKYPSLSLTGSIAVPSTAEVYVNNLLVSSRRLYPGLFRLEDIPTTVGYGVAEVVLRDDFGKKTVLSHPFFYSENVIKKGLHEYSYGAGFLRKDLGIESFSYGKAALIASHSYGFGETLKGGYRFEASDDLVNAGPAGSIVLSTAGILDAAAAVSGSAGETGFGGFLGYSFFSKSVRLSTSVKYLSEGYSNLFLRPGDDKPVTFGALAGLNNRRLGSATVGYTKSDYRTSPDGAHYTASYNKNITRGSTFIATATRTDSEGREPQYEVSFGLHVHFGRNTSGSVSYNRREDRSTRRAGVSKNLPLGTGFGFRADVEDSDGETAFKGGLQYQGRSGACGAAYRQMDGTRAYTLSLSGGIGYIDGSVFMSRTITDGFAKVKVGDLKGVRVYYAGSEAGRTNEKGEAVIPNLLSFYDNRLSIEGKDIPVNYTVPSFDKYVSPPYRGGASVRFDIRRIQGISGNVYVIGRGGRAAVEFSTLTVFAEGRAIEGLVGKDGEFYIENVPPGAHPAKVIHRGGECDFAIIIPESEDIWIELGEIVCLMN